MGRVGTDRTIPYIISTGGGPGLMEAANRGASRVHGGISAGVSCIIGPDLRSNGYHCCCICCHIFHALS